MKYGGAMLICLACLSMGQAYCKIRKDRLCTLKSLYSAFELMKAELGTRLTSLPQISSILSGKYSGAAGKFFEELSGELEKLGQLSFSEIWQNTADSCLYPLKAPELDELKALGYILGREEISEQREAIGSFLHYIKHELQEARHEYPSEKKLGLGIGAAAAGLLILGLI